MSAASPLSDLKAAELRLAQAVTPFIADLGLNRASLLAGAKALGWGQGELDLACPNGAADIAAVLWQGFDSVLESPETLAVLATMKVRDKIGFLLNLRLDTAAADEGVARHLMGFFALPTHAVLYHRLLWQTADTIWLKAGDKALDENHYSKRMIVSGILTTAMMTRLTQGRDAQLAQIQRNIEQVMAFEKFKAKLPAKPEELLLKMAKSLGSLRFGRTEKAVS